jgi:hypothetical protein
LLVRIQPEEPLPSLRSVAGSCGLSSCHAALALARPRERDRIQPEEPLFPGNSITFRRSDGACDVTPESACGASTAGSGSSRTDTASGSSAFAVPVENRSGGSSSADVRRLSRGISAVRRAGGHPIAGAGRSVRATVTLRLAPLAVGRPDHGSAAHPRVGSPSTARGSGLAPRPAPRVVRCGGGSSRSRTGESHVDASRRRSLV